METTVIGAVASAASGASVVASTGFLAGVGATIMGNLIFIVLFLAICGMFSYNSSDDTIGWGIFWGVVIAVIVGLTQTPMIFVWYLLASLVVMAVQLTWFDVRTIERKNANNKPEATYWIKPEATYCIKPEATYWSYRWFRYSKDATGEVSLTLNRASMGRYGVGYVAIAPFLVVHWVFGELIRSVVDVFVDAVSNSLTRRLSKVFDGVTVQK